MAFRGFAQLLQAKLGIIPEITQPIPSPFFPVHCELTILSFEAA
jgi:hypothetical protein